MEQPSFEILLVEDDEKLREIMADELKEHGHRAMVAESLKSAREKLATDIFDLVITDLKLPDGEGFELLEERNELSYKPEFIVITAFGTVAQAVKALKGGATDFITKPLDLEHFELTVEKVLKSRKLQQEIQELRERYERKSFHGIIGKGHAMQDMFKQIKTMAKAEGPVLILGESGTGKELIAHAIHNECSRRSNPFIPVNCASIPSDLFESEFFGHKEGSFTGAKKEHRGLIQDAAGGTLFLDEISEMPLDLQAKLLRFLQEKTIRPVGGDETVVDVRIVAASNRDLQNLVEKGEFREDLFYRLETFSLFAPPLRDRVEDIDILVASFIRDFSSELGKKVDGISPVALDKLRDYDFPGNVRELKSIIERAVAFCDDSLIEIAHFPAKLQAELVPKNIVRGQQEHGFSLNSETIIPLSDLEQKYISYVLNRVEGNKRRAASLLGIGRRTLYRRLEEREGESENNTK